MPKMLAHCPVCESPLGISELSCGNCQTRIQGRFDPCRFCRLAPEHLAFVETFLRCEGNLSRVEKELNLSYPTVRSRFSAALAALGFAGNENNLPPAAQESKPDYETRRREVLESLARGSLSAEQAANALRELTEGAN